MYHVFRSVLLSPLYHVIKDILLAGLCVLGVASILSEPGKYSRSNRVAFITAFAVLATTLVVDSVWPTRTVVSMAAAGFCLVWEIVLLLSPSTGWPRSYVWTLKIGWAMAFIGLSLFVGVRIGLVPLSYTSLSVAGVLAVSGAVLLVVAHAVLRPKGRPRMGVW